MGKHVAVTTVRDTTRESPPGRSGRFVRDHEPEPIVVEAEERQPRPRHDVPTWARPLARPFFRYSMTRDAWVMLGIGHKRGPVIRDLNVRQ